MSRRRASIRCRGATSGGFSTNCCAEGVAILTSTAYLDEAERCHRVALMHQGSCCSAIRPANLKTQLRKGVLSVASPEPRACTRQRCEGAKGFPAWC